jgi:serine phosphatase RsbU (regulator of sigma subunit)
VRKSADAPLLLVDPPVQPLGVVVKWFDPPPEPIQFEPGGQLILMTDGIFEASCDGNQMGVEQMCKIVEQFRDSPPEGILGALREEARRWYGDQDPLDDQTVVIVEREK